VRQGVGEGDHRTVGVRHHHRCVQREVVDDPTEPGEEVVPASDRGVRGCHAAPGVAEDVDGEDAVAAAQLAHIVEPDGRGGPLPRHQDHRWSSDRSARVHPRGAERRLHLLGGHLDGPLAQHRGVGAEESRTLFGCREPRGWRVGHGHLQR